MAAEKFQFQAESRELLNLMIHSIYTNKEIFLRELISNASDALDKIRIEAISKPDLLTAGEPLQITLQADAKERTLSIVDNGIGMNHDDLVNHIGTIAKSGTREFIQKLKESKDNKGMNEMIGQFGVGFYSAFMAADKISILTRKAGDSKAYLWESSGDGEFTITEAEKPSCGTSIKLHLKPIDDENGLEDFTQTYVLSRIVKKYSDFISYPIVLKEEKEDKTLNSMKPIWTRAQSEVKDEEYKEFYKHISHDWNEPLKVITYKAEGTVEFHSLLFIPSKAPFDMFYQGYKSGLELYVKKVLIMEAFEDLLPKYMRFVKGVVESSDLPLNISRETLQQDRIVIQMRKNITRKVLDSLQDMAANEKDKFNTFYQEFGSALKEGVGSDFENREKMLPLLRFESSNSTSEKTSLTDYVGRMKEGQEEIYYLTGESRTILENSPHLEGLKDKGIEVLYLVDPIDELMLQYVTEFQGKKLKSAAKGDISIGTKEEKEKIEKEIKEKAGELEGLLKTIQEKLSGTIKEVKLSGRLVHAPACLVGTDQDISPYLERLLRKEGSGGSAVKRILELNPNHPVVEKLSAHYKKDPADSSVGKYAELLLGYAILSEGSPLPDPQKFNSLVVELMEKTLD